MEIPLARQPLAKDSETQLCSLSSRDLKRKLFKTVKISEEQAAVETS